MVDFHEVNLTQLVHVDPETSILSRIALQAIDNLTTDLKQGREHRCCTVSDRTARLFKLQPKALEAHKAWQAHP